MTRQEIKLRARQQLGGQIFGNLWLMALLVCFVYAAICGAAGTILPGIGAIIILGPMGYGLSLVFLKQYRYGGEMDFSDLFRGFTDDFGQTFLIGLLTSIFTFLWGLLFVIPGIVKTYSYSMAYYIKIDNPDYGWRECIDASRAMMNGHKWDLFVLDLSFIGWYIVGSLVLGIGTLWVVPYHTAARTIFYDNLCAAQQGQYGAGTYIEG